jgi:C_GCAxxG_C_C family probable redox protein
MEFNHRYFQKIDNLNSITINFIVRKMSDIIQLTLDYWDQEHNCAISTACGTLKYFGEKDVTDFYNSFLGFGGGIGEGSACGAVVGVLAAMGKILSDHGLSEKQIRYSLGDFRTKFIEKHGSINCQKILEEFKVEGGVDYEHPDRRIKCTGLVKNSVTDAKAIIEIETNPLIPVMRRYDISF